jgi:hypothetical protein
MESLQEKKMALMLRGLAPCPSLDQIYAQLNGVKTRLLGDRCLLLTPPQATLPHGAFATMVKKESAAMRKMARSSNEVSVDEPEETKWQLAVSIVSGRNVRAGSASVYAQLSCNGYRYKSQAVKRVGSPPHLSAPFAADVVYTFHDVEEDSTLELRLLEEGLSHTQLGKAEVPLARLKSNQTKLTEWCELKKGAKDTGQVCLVLQMISYEGTSARGGKAGASSGHASAKSKTAADRAAADKTLASDKPDERDEKLEFFTLSGGWQGYSWRA